MENKSDPAWGRRLATDPLRSPRDQASERSLPDRRGPRSITADSGRRRSRRFPAGHDHRLGDPAGCVRRRLCGCTRWESSRLGMGSDRAALFPGSHGPL